MFRFLLIFFSLNFFVSKSYADCISLYIATEKKAAEIRASMKGVSVCKSSQLTVEIMELKLVYIKACHKANSPGPNKKDMEEAIEYAKNVADTICK